MKCPRDKEEMIKEYLLEIILHKCLKCGIREFTDYSGKPVSQEKKMEFLDMYNEN
jgi:hypothetical protein